MSHVEQLFPRPNPSSIIDLFIYANTVTSNAFGYLILIAVYIITFISLKNYPTERAFASASFITAITSVFMAVLGLVPTFVVLFPTILAIVSIFILARSGGGE